MRFVSYNIQYGLGKDGQTDLDRIAATVDGADVIALQEVERFARRSGFVDQAAELSRRLPAYHWVYGAGLDMDAGEVAADGQTVHRRRQFGNMLLSRMPILSSRNFPLPKYATLTQLSLQRSALEGVIRTRHGAVRVYSIHLTHLSDATRAPQIEAILEIHRRAPGEGGPWCGTPDAGWTEDRPPPPMPREAILMGDFNLPATSPLYERLAGPTAPGRGRMTNPDGFVDAWVATGHGENDGMTCDSGGENQGKRIDYCFVSTSLAGTLRRAWIDGAAQGSDHQPIWTEIEL